MTSNISPPDVALVDLLGRLDALFAPRRGDFVQAAMQVRCGLREDWQTKGLPSRTRGASANDRKVEESMLRAMENAGLVTIAAAGGRRTHVRFAHAGEMRARCMTATGNVVDGWPFFDALVGLFDLAAGQQLSGTHADGRLLSEAFAAGCTPWRRTKRQIADLTRQCFSLLPFLAAGWITSSPDSGGRYWLSLTDAGRVAHAAGCPADPCPDIRLSEPASALYDRTFREYSAESDGMTPRQGSPIVVPIPVGVNWGGYPV